MFEIEWKTPRHNILVEFLKNWKLDPKHNRIKLMLGDEQRIINKHVLAKVLKIFHIKKTKVDQAEMLHAKITLAYRVDGVLDTYNMNEGWVMKKMRSK